MPSLRLWVQPQHIGLKEHQQRHVKYHFISVIGEAPLRRLCATPTTARKHLLSYLGLTRHHIFLHRQSIFPFFLCKMQLNGGTYQGRAKKAVFTKNTAFKICSTIYCLITFTLFHKVPSNA